MNVRKLSDDALEGILEGDDEFTQEEQDEAAEELERRAYDASDPSF